MKLRYILMTGKTHPLHAVATPQLRHVMVILMLSGHHSLLVRQLPIGLELALQESELATLPLPVRLHHLLLHAAVVHQQDRLRQYGRLVRLVLLVEGSVRVGMAIARSISGPISRSCAYEVKFRGPFRKKQSNFYSFLLSLYRTVNYY